MNKKQMFNEVLDKVISRAQSWNAKILSQASTITLVKSFLASIPTYTSATFYLSKKHLFLRVLAHFFSPSNPKKLLHILQL